MLYAAHRLDSVLLANTGDLQALGIAHGGHCLRLRQSVTNLACRLLRLCEAQDQEAAAADE
jgi:hypothetical protein